MTTDNPRTIRLDAADNVVVAGCGLFKIAGEYFKSGGEAIVIDHLDYSLVGPNQSYGAYPEGQGSSNSVFHYPSPGTANSPTSQPIEVYINEWMAANRALRVRALLPRSFSNHQRKSTIKGASRSCIPNDDGSLFERC